MDAINSTKVFNHGATWLKADFHLHTKEDKEFQYAGTENDFITQYIDKLKEEKISLAVITNHNKFACSEHKALSMKARKEEIYVLFEIIGTGVGSADGIYFPIRSGNCSQCRSRKKH